MIILALIGTGSWGQNYIKTIGRIKDANLKYVCSLNKESLGNFSDKYLKLTDYKNLPKYQDINGVIIATPASTHYEIAKFFLSRGQNVLIEKPLTTNLKGARELAEIAKMKKSVAMVGHIYLYNSAYSKFKEFIGKIGKIKYFDFEGCDFGPFREDVTALWDWAPHDVSMCLDLLSEMPQSVSAWSVGRDMVYARLKFKNAQAFMKLGWRSPEKKRKVTIVGSKSSLIFDDTKEKKVILFENKRLNKPQHLDYVSNEPLMNEVQEFINSIQENKKPKTNLVNSVLVIRVIDAFQKSIDNNGEIIRLS